MDGGCGGNGNGNGNDSGNTVIGGVHRRKPTKKTKNPKKKPIKVVYISNPMKIQTSASEFMALVQELTGQDADFPDPSKFPVTDSGGSPRPDLDKTVTSVGVGGGDDVSNLPSLAVELPAEDLDLGYLQKLAADDSFYDAFDDLFPPPVIGNFSGLFPAALLYESYAR